MWGRIEPLMPAVPVRGRWWADHRRTLEAIAWKHRTNSPWRDLTDELGPFQTAHKRLIRWAVDGSVGQVLDQAQLSGVGDVCAACRLGRTAEQEPAGRVGEDHGLDRVLLVLAGDELVPVLAAGSGPADADLDAVNDPGLPGGPEVLDDLGEGAESDAGHDGAAACCERGPHLADGAGDRGAVDPEAAGRCPYDRRESVALSPGGAPGPTDGGGGMRTMTAPVSGAARWRIASPLRGRAGGPTPPRQGTPHTAGSDLVRPGADEPTIYRAADVDESGALAFGEAVTAALPDTPAPDGAALVTTSAPRSRAGPAGRASRRPSPPSSPTRAGRARDPRG